MQAGVTRPKQPLKTESAHVCLIRRGFETLAKPFRQFASFAQAQKVSPPTLSVLLWVDSKANAK